MKIRVLGTWLIISVALGAAGFFAANVGWHLTKDNITWLAFAAFSIFIGKMFSMAVTAYEEPDKLLLQITEGIAALFVAGAFITTFVYVAANGFDAQGTLWSLVTVPLIGYTINKYLNMVGNFFYVLAEKRKEERKAQRSKANEEWLKLEAFKFDKWEKQYEAGKLPSNYEEL